MDSEKLDPVRKTLLPPLKFAARDDFARADRLVGFSSLVERAVQSAGLDDELGASLLKASQGFEGLDREQRKARIITLLRVLDDDKGPAPASGPPPAVAEDRSVAAQSPPPGVRRPSRPVAPRAPRPDATTVAKDVLEQPTSLLRGIGPARREALAARGLATIGDVLALLPRAYEDRRRVMPIGHLSPGMTAVIKGRIVASGQVGRGRGGRYEVVLDDGTGRIKLVFFRFRSWDMSRRFAMDQDVTATGSVQRYRTGLQLVHPSVMMGDRTDDLAGIVPLYPELKGLHTYEIEKAVKGALSILHRQPPRDLLPPHIMAAANVISFHDALLDVHAPSEDLTDDELNALNFRRAPAHRRLCFEELFVLQLAMLMKQQHTTAEPAPALSGPDGASLSAELLPFAPTSAQARSIEEILRDLAAPRPMNRLLQGDVGAGKTAVAAVAALFAVRAKAQAAIMAPTEILAEQHYETFRRLFHPLGIRVELFTGQQKGKARALAVGKLKNRVIDIAVGTHALFSDDVEFARLALCVIDEQHRFGVAQRVALKQKGPLVDGERQSPHVLVMTATPIPRSLALTVYGDLTVSVLDELPPGRTPVTTKVKTERGMKGVFDHVGAALGRGERVYVVYPLIEESEKLDLKDATQGAQTFAEQFGDDKVGLVHGRMSTEEREAAMARFIGGDTQILVATTVIEVGVDVPEATCMIVMHAERFGLSQLHQLRGRVGRSDRKSHCFLVVGKSGAGKDAIQRLRIMEQTTDGFRIAEEDLRIRGPGDFLGTRQSGLPTLAFADLTRNRDLIELARELADEVLAQDPTLSAPVHRDLRDLVFHRFKDRLELVAVG